ncbi:hypothetical protein TSAR_008806 [Trichomalopsis sarcophagae]|uniref:Uncharacterized protein n=1 Tax=Trichomalopsis sarcophagae TaxID=543379 RepID=A0A232END2_9HYME|nr:hypothetical protein TSAR_008806 [Trichomalopsis sarcophagae]
MMLNEHDHATFFAEMDDQSVLLDQFSYHIVEFVAAGRKPKMPKTDIKRVLLRDIHHHLMTQKNLMSWIQRLKNYKMLLVRVSLGDAYRKHELLTNQKTTLTAESGESDTEAEQRFANPIRQEQLRSAAKSFNDALRKKGTKRSSDPMIHLLYRTVYLHGANKRLLNAVLDCMTKISTDISSLSLDVKTMKLDISKIKAAVKDTKIIRSTTMDFIATVPQLSKKYNDNITFKTMAEFQIFNSHLLEKSDLKESVSIVLQSGLDPQKVISKSIVSVLNMFLTKDVAIQCRVTVVIKEHRLIANLETTDKDITSSLSTVLSNASQWYVTRKSLPENATKSTTPAQKSKVSKNYAASTASVQVVAIEPTTQKDLNDPNAVFTPMQFEFANIEEDEEEFDDEFYEDYLSRLNVQKDHLNPMIHLLYRTVYLVLRLSVTTFQTMEKVMGSLRQKSEHGANKRLLNAVLDCMTKISTDISSLSLDVKNMKLDISKIKAAVKDTKKIRSTTIDFIATVPQLSKNMLKMFLTKDIAIDRVPIRDKPFLQLMANLETTDKDITSSLCTVLSNASQWYVPRKYLPENATKSTSPAQKSKGSKNTTALTASVQVVAIEPTTQKDLNDSMQFLLQCNLNLQM